jgi:hypothetical protein
MKRKLIFALVVAFFLVPWASAYAHNIAKADTAPVDIQPAPSATQPVFNSYSNSIGGVIPGDVFIIDCSGSDMDTEFNLYITNTDDLVKSYRYVNLQIGIYMESGNGAWQKISEQSGENAADFYITMQNSHVNFFLPGGAKYKVMIDKGCFNRYPAVKGKGATLPEFYLAAG